MLLDEVLFLSLSYVCRSFGPNECLKVAKMFGGHNLFVENIRGAVFEGCVYVE